VFTRSFGGSGSVVGIATGYGSGIDSRCWRDFPHPSRPALEPTQLLYNGYRVFPGGKKRPRRDADPLPLLVPWSRKGRVISLIPLWDVGLYRASVLLQGCTLHLTYEIVFVEREV
jgi:hypothetical protein